MIRKYSRVRHLIQGLQIWPGRGVALYAGCPPKIFILVLKFGKVDGIMRSVEEALKTVIDNIKVLGTERILIQDSLGQVIGWGES